MTQTHHEQSTTLFENAYRETKKSLNVPDEILIRLNETFFASVGGALEKLKEAMNANDYEAMKMHAHSVKGASSTLHYVTISAIAAEIEEHAQQKEAYAEGLIALSNEFAAASDGYRMWKSARPSS